MLAGCSDQVDPEANFKENPLYCQEDTDCKWQVVLCNCCCGGTTVVNKAHWNATNCPPCEIMCDEVCPNLAARCVEGKCTAVEMGSGA